MRRIRITVAYDGTRYHGWQVQPELETIQGVLERVVGEIEGSAVNVHGSGRTDAGVHALAQVAAFDLTNPIPIDNLRRAMNRLLPRDIRVLGCEEAPADFHPRFQAKAKTYEYRIWREEICPPFERLYVCHHPYPLDEAKMTAAAMCFVGEHDFTAYAAADEKDECGRSKVRTIFFSSLERRGALLMYRVCGSGFLKHMVRLMVGALVEVGKGNLDAPSFEQKAGRAMPASGLFLVSVEY